MLDASIVHRPSSIPRKALCRRTKLGSKELPARKTSRITHHASRVRFFVPNGLLRGEKVSVPGEVAHQISRVLRIKPGDEVVLLDGLGYEFFVRLEEFGKDFVSGTVVERRMGRGEPAHQVDLYLSLLNK